MDENVRVRFVTQHAKYRVTETPFLIPTNLGRRGLSDIVLHLLFGETNEDNSAKSKMMFDFLIKGHIMRLTLAKFLRQLKQLVQVSTEDILTIEYFPAAAIDKDNQIPSTELPAWIGCLKTLDISSEELILTGCYDGQVRIVGSSQLISHPQQGGLSFAAHSEPVRAVCSWACAPEEVLQASHASKTGKKKPIHGKKFQYLNVVTSSKDHSLKLWGMPWAEGGEDAAAEPPRLIATIPGSSSAESLGLATKGNDRVLLCGDWNGLLRAFSVPSDLRLFDVENAEQDADDLTKRRRIASGAVPGQTQTSPSPPLLFSIKAHSQALTGIDSGEEGASLFTSSWDHSLKLWDFERQDCLASFISPKVVTSLHRRPGQASGNVVATSHPDGKVRLWDARRASGEGVGDLSTPTASFGVSSSSSWISTVRWRPDSEFLFATSDHAGRVALWDCRAAAAPLLVHETHPGSRALCLDWLCLRSNGGTSTMAEGVGAAAGNRSSRRAGKEGIQIERVERKGLSDASRIMLLSGGSDCHLRATPLSGTY